MKSNERERIPMRENSTDFEMKTPDISTGGFHFAFQKFLFNLKTIAGFNVDLQLRQFVRTFMAHTKNSNLRFLT